jgi:hypothetical protein
MYRSTRLAGMLLFAFQSASFAQKITIPNPSACTSIPSSLSGHGCSLAFDGNSGTEYQGSSTSGSGRIELTLDLGSVKGIKRVVITWGTIRPSGYQINFRSRTTDPYLDIAGGSPSGATEDITFPWSWAMGGTPDTARYVQIQSFPGVTRMDIKEIVMYGSGVYGEDEIVSEVFPLGNLNLSQTSTPYTLPTPISNAKAARMIGIDAVITGDDGTVQPLNRMMGLPEYPADQVINVPPTYGKGGAVSLRPSASGLDWRIVIEQWGQHFLLSNFHNSTTRNRGYVTLYYLSHDPDYPTRE